MNNWPKDNWKNLHRVWLSDGLTLTVYSRPADWMNAADVRRYGLHIATKDGTWGVKDYLDGSFRDATAEEVALFDASPLLES